MTDTAPDYEAMAANLTHEAAQFFDATEDRNFARDFGDIALKALRQAADAAAARERERNAEIERKAVQLADAEAAYRKLHDLKGAGDVMTGRAWDHMRHCGDAIRNFTQGGGNDT